MTSSLMTPVNVRALRPGDRLARAVFSRDGAKLLPRGAQLTPDLCATLRSYEGGVLFYSVVAPRRDPAASHGALIGEMIEDKPAHPLSAREADAIIARRATRWGELPNALERSPAEWGAAPAPAFLPDEREARGLRSTHAATLRELIDALAEGLLPDLAPAERLAAELVSLAHTAPGMLARLAAPGERTLEYLPEHALATGALCALVARGLHAEERASRRAALTGLLCDAGMALLPASLRIADSRLDEIDLNRVRRHPSLSAALLARLGGVDEHVIRAIYQHHERCDGSGYPTRARGGQIAELTKIAGVAESYAAATAFRPYRLVQKRPHDAMLETLRAAAGGSLDKACARALVAGLGIYPLGSWVRLTDGRRAVVAALNAGAPTRPVVRTVEPPQALDLSGAADASILCATDAPLAPAPPQLAHAA